MYKDAAKEILNWILLYYDRFILIMVAIALVYLFFSQKDSRAKIIYPIALIFVCVLNPVLYHYVLKEIIYWRVFWLLPESIIIGYGLAHLVKRVKPAVVKVAVLVIMVAVLIAGGNNVYKVADFEQTKNQQKVATETKTVGDIMLSIDKNPKCIVPEELAWEMRIYSGDIELLYGRNADGYINWPDDVAAKVCNELYKEVPDADYVFGTAFNKKIDFVVLPRGKSINDDIAASYGYYMIDAVDGYPIYHNDDIDNRRLGGWIVTQYGNSSEGGYFYTVEDENNNLIIIDGGCDWYYPRLEAVIREHNNHVNAWIITSARYVHSTSFQEIVSRYPRIQIDRIYAQEITSDMIELQKRNAKDWEGKEYATSLMSLLENMNNVIYVKEGDQFNELGLTFTVLHTWDEEVNAIGEFHSWNGSVCFLMEGTEEKMLFLSSLTAPMEKHIMDRHIDKLDCDYVQVNNQGEWFFSADFYDVVSAHTAFIDCGKSAIDPQTDNAARYVYDYMESRGTITYILEDAPNWVIMR